MFHALYCYVIFVLSLAPKQCTGQHKFYIDVIGIIFYLLHKGHVAENLQKECLFLLKFNGSIKSQYLKGTNFLIDVKFKFWLALPATDAHLKLLLFVTVSGEFARFDLNLLYTHKQILGVFK